ncbi:CLUMA_CG013625, isoform A [Clunio marinus]|uniref:CLUMA_CG013625, isoform A n=1 Tax=Clunio marinus TaxID=568069 RepID=A0A1J1IJI1_9DIPT|nr:CLUMA_CG013625, isoform A [Clunio marinus]
MSFFKNDDWDKNFDENFKRMREDNDHFFKKSTEDWEARKSKKYKSDMFLQISNIQLTSSSEISQEFHENFTKSHGSSFYSTYFPGMFFIGFLIFTLVFWIAAYGLKVYLDKRKKESEGSLPLTTTNGNQANPNSNVTYVKQTPSAPPQFQQNQEHFNNLLPSNHDNPPPYESFNKN